MLECADVGELFECHPFRRGRQRSIVNRMSQASSGAQPHFCNFRFQSNVDVLPPVRRFVSEIVDRLIRRPEVASRLEVAVHELVENSLKYSQGAGSFIEIEVFDTAGRMRIVVRTTNRVSDEYAETVRQLVSDMEAAASDPIKYYLQALEKSAARTHGSGLGLARVFAESGMKLATSRPSKDEICVTAELFVDP